MGTSSPLTGFTGVLSSAGPPRLGIPGAAWEVGLLEVGLGGGEEFLEGRSVTTRCGEGRGPDELSGLPGSGRLVDAVPLLGPEPEGEDAEDFLRGLLLLRLGLFLGLGLLHRLCALARGRGAG